MKTLLESNARSSSRMPLDLDITLFHHQGDPMTARLQDISFGGVYVATENNPPTVDSTVTLGLSLFEDGAEKVYSMSAVVVRTEDKGAGLMFDDYDGETIKCLRHLYHNALN